MCKSIKGHIWSNMNSTIWNDNNKNNTEKSGNDKNLSTTCFPVLFSHFPLFSDT